MLTSLCVCKQWCSARTVLIKSLYELKAYTACQFVMEFPDKGWRKCSNKGLLRKLRNDAALTCSSSSMTRGWNVDVIDDAALTWSSSSVTWVKCRRYWRRCWWMTTQNFTCVWEDETPSLWTSAKLNSSIHSHLHFSLPTKHVTPRDITVLILKNKYIKHQYLSMGLTSICASEKKTFGENSCFSQLQCTWIWIRVNLYTPWRDVYLCSIMSPDKMMFTVLELWLSSLQWVLNW